MVLYCYMTCRDVLEDMELPSRHVIVFERLGADTCTFAAEHWWSPICGVVPAGPSGLSAAQSLPHETGAPHVVHRSPAGGSTRY